MSLHLEVQVKRDMRVLKWDMEMRLVILIHPILESIDVLKDADTLQFMDRVLPDECYPNHYKKRGKLVKHLTGLNVQQGWGREIQQAGGIRY